MVINDIALSFLNYVFVFGHADACDAFSVIHLDAEQWELTL
jgi:hypothetical protein